MMLVMMVMMVMRTTSGRVMVIWRQWWWLLVCESFAAAVRALGTGPDASASSIAHRSWLAS